jgi:hypothetical protein
MKMTAYDLMSAIAFTTPLFCGIREGSNHGLVAIIAGILFGMFFGIIVCLAFRKAGLIIFRMLPEDGKRQLLSEILGLIFYLAAFIMVGFTGFITLVVMKSLF